jgi:hypothetical protein
MGTDTTTKPTAADQHAMRRRELAAMCETLSSYSDADWDHDTYCTGWRVRDVVGHMLAGYTTGMATGPQASTPCRATASPP